MGFWESLENKTNVIDNIEDDLHEFQVMHGFDNLEKIFDLCLSALLFLYFIPAQCEWPAINYILFSKHLPKTIGSTLFAKPVSLSAITISPEIVASPSAG